MSQHESWDNIKLGWVIKYYFLISQPKHVVGAQKNRLIVSMRRFFWAPKTCVKTDELEYINIFNIHFLFVSTCDKDIVT